MSSSRVESSLFVFSHVDNINNAFLARIFLFRPKSSAREDLAVMARMLYDLRD